MNFILLIFIYSYTGNAEGGTAAVVTQVPMPSMQVCETAAAKVRQGLTAGEKGQWDMKFWIHTREAVCISNKME